MRARRRGILLAGLFCALLLPLCAASQEAPPPAYDLFLRADSGAVSIWINTATGEFRWVDRRKGIDFSAVGALAFPNLGPMLLSYSGEAPGFDWALLALKLYGTQATGSLTLFPEGERVHKVVSLLWDRDTRDDRPDRPRRRKPPPPAVGEVRTAPKPEVPAP